MLFIVVFDKNTWGCRKHGIAGATAGLTNVLVLHPLDVVKTRLQVQDGAGSLPLYNGTLDAIKKIIRSDGIKGLYAGKSDQIRNCNPLLQNRGACITY